MYFNNILKYDCFVNQWRLLPEYILWVKVRSMLWQLAWQWVVDVNNQLGFLILPFLPKGVAWICPRLSPSMQWYWYYLVPRRNTLVQDLARFVSKNVRESSFYWTGLSLSNNLETKCFSVMLILLFYFCMFIRLLCVSLYISIIVFHVMYYVYSIHEFVFISIIISYHFPWLPVLFVEYHSMGALEVFRLQGLGNYRL